jgi:hypothetical protein
MLTAFFINLKSNHMDILIGVKNQFIDSLNKHLTLYVTVGSSITESPMWYQFAGENNHSELLFKSSQRSSIGFKIPTPEGFNIYEEDYMEVYNYFKRIKYEHIKDYWPSVYQEIKGEQKELINKFLTLNS